MILADKIIELRKKNGWTQEELAEKLDVSRQSISKWEGAQAVPDLNRIIRLAEVFGVSTDFLLKDEMEMEKTPVCPGEDISEKTAVRSVSMEEASGFLEYKNKASGRIALGVMMCILSPVLLIITAVLQEAGTLPITEEQAAGIGLIALFVLVGGAVALFVTTGILSHRYEYLEKEPIETAYGVDGMVRERREKFRGTYTRQLTIGIVLCVISVIPVFAVMLLKGQTDVLAGIMAAVLLAMVAVGVLLIVRVSIVWGGFHMLLQEEDYTRERKLENKKNEPLEGIYWGAVTAGYLAYSFITGDWGRSWIVWPIAGVSYGVVTAIARALRKSA